MRGNRGQQGHGSPRAPGKHPSLVLSVMAVGAPCLVSLPWSSYSDDSYWV